MKYNNFGDAFMVYQEALNEFGLATRSIFLNLDDQEKLDKFREEQQAARLKLSQLIMDLWADKEEAARI